MVYSESSSHAIGGTMPNWISIFHAFFTDTIMPYGIKMTGAEFLMIIGLATAFCLLIIALIVFEENRRIHDDELRCIYTKFALKLLGLMVFLIIAGNYGGALLVILFGCLLIYALWRALEGIAISIGACKKQT